MTIAFCFFLVERAEPSALQDVGFLTSVLTSGRSTFFGLA
jgi:hypothetical protein